MGESYTVKHCIQALGFQPSYQYDLIHAKSFLKYVSEHFEENGDVRYDMDRKVKRSVRSNGEVGTTAFLEIRGCLPDHAGAVVACYKIRGQAVHESQENP